MKNPIVSPNTVFANALNNPLDLVKAKLDLSPKVDVARFHVGTQINGFPHIGTYFVQAGAFYAAMQVQDQYNIESKVIFGALDNAPYKVLENKNNKRYQMMYVDAFGTEGIREQIQENYVEYFEELKRVTGISYEIQTYTEQQATPEFREAFLKTLKHSENLGKILSPSVGQYKFRIPYTEDNLAEKDALNTKILSYSKTRALIESESFSGKKYNSEITVDNVSNVYLDINTLGRNLIKELVTVDDVNALDVMVKGGDWIYGCTLVDWAMGEMGVLSNKIPLRLFTPQIVTERGDKLSKSLIREGHQSSENIPSYMLDMRHFKDMSANYADKLVQVMGWFMEDTKHMCRSYSYSEVARLMKLDKL